MAKYKVGDKVRVKSDLVLDEAYYMEDKKEYNRFVSGMDKLRGQIVTIKSISCGQYRIEEHFCSWTDDMFEPVFKVGDKVKLRDDLVVGERYGSLELFAEMKKIQGKTCKIRSITSETNYYIKESIFCYSAEMLELVDATESTTESEETTMETFRIKNVNIIKDKVVIVEFSNGDIQKAVCDSKDTFDFERGLEVCVMKHLLGKSAYHKALKDADKQIKAIKEAAEKEKANAELKARKEAKEERRKKASAKRRRAARVAEMKEAYLSALKEYNGDTEKALEQSSNLQEAIEEVKRFEEQR